MERPLFVLLGALTSASIACNDHPGASSAAQSHFEVSAATAELEKPPPREVAPEEDAQKSLSEVGKGPSGQGSRASEQHRANEPGSRKRPTQQGRQAPRAAADEERRRQAERDAEQQRRQQQQEALRVEAERRREAEALKAAEARERQAAAERAAQEDRRRLDELLRPLEEQRDEAQRSAAEVEAEYTALLNRYQRDEPSDSFRARTPMTAADRKRAAELEMTLRSRRAAVKRLENAITAIRAKR